MATVWHALDAPTVITNLSTDETWGLSNTAVKERLGAYGGNTLKHEAQASPLSRIAAQFKSPLVFILLAAFAGTLYLREMVDAFVIALALLVNVAVGFIQEERAGRAFRALFDSEEHEVAVIRNGERVVVRTRALVPGDILFVGAGSVVPADAYLLSAADLAVSEAHLSGEAAPVEKHQGVRDALAPLYERSNMLYAGSPVLAGSATAVVVATGAQAEIGKVAHDVLGYRSSHTPVEESIVRLSHFITFLIAVVIVALLIIGAVRGMEIQETLLLAIALAVSVVPEGLPAAVTAILAIGMQNILKERGLVRNLLAAETLGSTTIILTDKTGTLTEGHMALSDLVIGSDRGYSPGALSTDQRFLLDAAFRVSDAFAVNGGTATYGRPIERAVVSAAFENGIREDGEGETQARGSARRIDFLKFTSARRFAAALYEEEGGATRFYFSGAPEVVLRHAHRFLEGGVSRQLSAAKRREIASVLEALAGEGKRLIGIALRDGTAHSIERSEAHGDLLSGAVFAGLIAFSDSPRQDVPEAIGEVRRAGVRVVMVTGDTPETARYIARTVGIAKEGDSEPVTGSALETMSDEAVYEAALRAPVFARIVPQQKKRLVDILSARGEVVGMTGDGVNDAPALKAAAIGIAVGSGTEVAREASDLILLGDSFSIIVSAIREGRRIMDNLKKSVAHLIATSFHEVFVISAAVFVGLPLPILPVQILWVNIIEEGFLSFAFAFEPAEPRVMRRSPKEAGLRTVLTRQVRTIIILAGLITSAFSVGLYLWLLSRGLPIEEIRTIMFVALSLDALLFAVSLKSLHRPFWTTNLFNNRYLIFALALSTAGIIATLEVSPIREALSLAPPNAFDLAVLALVAAVNLVTIEFAKKIAFKTSHSSSPS